MKTSIDLEHLSRLISHYQWEPFKCRKAHPDKQSWVDEIIAMDNEGYTLVPPDYHIPSWQTALVMSAVLPKLYVLRDSGPDVLTTHMDCCASRLGYPIYFKRP